MQLTDRDRVGYGSRGMASSSSGDYLRTATTMMTVRRGGAVPAASDFNVSYQGGGVGSGSGSRRRYDWELYGDEDGKVIGNDDRRQARRRPVSCRGMRCTGPSSTGNDDCMPPSMMFNYSLEECWMHSQR